MSRIDYKAVAPDGYSVLRRMTSYIADSGLDETLRHLIYLRVSQINGCTYCIDRHWSDAVRAGLSQRLLNSLVAWKENSWFSKRQRAALAWAETLTNVSTQGAPDATYEAVVSEFNESELANLTYAIAHMNALNRLAIGLQHPKVDGTPA